MTNSTESGTTITALDILKETRELFAQTHWIAGNLYTTDTTGKKKFCMVGGLCHVFATKEFPEWLSQNRQTFYANTLEDYFIQDEIDTYPFEELLLAEREFAKTVDITIDEDSDPVQVEDAIVAWNDSFITKQQFKDRGDAGYVLEKMDETIERLEKQS